MTELTRTGSGQVLNKVEVFGSDKPGKVRLKLSSISGPFIPLAVSLDNEEIDDLIVMLEYHRKEANDAFAAKQERQDTN